MHHFHTATPSPLTNPATPFPHTNSPEHHFSTQPPIHPVTHHSFVFVLTKSVRTTVIKSVSLLVFSSFCSRLVRRFGRSRYPDGRSWRWRSTTGALTLPGGGSIALSRKRSPSQCLFSQLHHPFGLASSVPHPPTASPIHTLTCSHCFDIGPIHPAIGRD